MAMRRYSLGIFLPALLAIGVGALRIGREGWTLAAIIWLVVGVGLLIWTFVPCDRRHGASR